MRLTRLVAPSVAVLSLFCAPSAGAAVFLDTHDPGRDRFAGPAKTRPALKAGVPYVVTAKGTFSQYSSSWVKNPGGTCGTSTRRPQYRSPGVRNGRTGGDAVFIYADKRRQCQLAGGVPHIWTGLQVAAQGKRFFELDSLLDEVTAPRADHTYRFAIVGSGQRLKVRMRDPNTRDNYGRLRFTIARAQPADCVVDYPQWGYAFETDCVTATQS